MTPAKLAAGAALLGGVLWIVHALLGGGSDPLPATLHFVGLACILVASAVFGSSLVKSDAVAMRIVVGLGLRPARARRSSRRSGSPTARGTTAFWGIVAALIGGIALLRGRGQSPGRPRHGAHAR